MTILMSNGMNDEFAKQWSCAYTNAHNALIANFVISHH